MPEPQPRRNRLVIRPAALADAAAITGLLRAVGWWPALNEADPAHLTGRIAAQLALDLQDASHSVFVAVSMPEDELIGYAAVHWLPYFFLPGPEGFISELFIHPQARGLGAGTRLLEAVEEAARRRGCARLSLLNSRERDSYERKFYENHGWEERPMMANFVRRLK